MQFVLLAQCENQYYRAAQNGCENKRSLRERGGLTQKLTPDHPPFAAALWSDGDTIADDRHPFAAIELLFQGDSGIRPDIGNGHQVQPGLWGHLLHNLLKALGVIAKHQRVDGLAAFDLRQCTAGFYVTEVRSQQQFALLRINVQRLLRAGRK
ncbi:hypothetical protein D3C72_706590 [compost metagenome]